MICVLRLQAIWVHAQAHGTARLAPVEPCLVSRDKGTGGKVLRNVLRLSVQKAQCSFLLSTCLSWTHIQLWHMGSSTSTWFYACIYGTLVSCLYYLDSCWYTLCPQLHQYNNISSDLRAWCDLVIASMKILSRPSASACFFTSDRWSCGNIGNVICNLRRRPSPIQEQS